MQIEIDSRKTVEQNASDYYENSKKFKKKLEGLETAIFETEKLLKKAELEESEKKAIKKLSRKKEWFERFHWFYLEDHLVIGARDAKTNDLLFQKYMDKEDIFMHADIHGGSVIIVKQGQELSKKKLEYAAIFAGCFSKAWNSGKGTINVSAVNADQVKKASKTGSFFLTGERTYFKNVELKLGITFENDKLVIKPVDLIKGEKIIIKPDTRKDKGESTKLVLKKLKELFPDKDFDINWVQELLPNGGSRVS